jgi:hypothetical protein
MAAVSISCSDAGSGVADIYYDAQGEVELIRAFGLDIEADTANIIAVTDVNPNYYIYPGTIQITDGNVTAWGTPVAPANDPGAGTGLGTGSVTIEMGSLYAAGDGNLTPDPCGLLCKVSIDANCTLTITTNVTRGGVVMEDTATPTVSQTQCAVVGPPDCYFGMADYNEWVAVDKPECWCYPRQCHGDATGYPYGKSNYWASSPDLTVLKDAYNKDANTILGQTSTVDGHVTQWACADFDHLPYGKSNYRVSSPDLQILKDHFNIANGPDANCLPGNETP